MRRILLTATLTAALMATSVAAVSGAGQIVIRGADSGSHLHLKVSGDTLVVHGYMASQAPDGCRFTQFRTDAVCSLAGVDSIQIVMGPSGDKIEVDDALPVPLTTYLGRGSDKL